MNIGIFGLPYVGKSVIFSLLTELPYQPEFLHNAKKGVVKIKDKRLEKIAKFYNSKKIVYSTFEFLDTPGYDPNLDAKEKNKIFQMFLGIDAFLLVIRAFENPSVPFSKNLETPLKQLNYLISELFVRDYTIAENKFEKLKDTSKKKKLEKDEEILLHTLEKILPYFENEKLIKWNELSEDEKKSISSFEFFTLKPIIVLVNIDENQFESNDYPDKETLKKFCENNNFAYIELPGKLEMDIMELNEDERNVFMESYGIKEMGMELLTRTIYEHLGYITFFTANEKEAHSWIIKKGASVLEAAHKIHSDLAKHFIKAEIIKYDDLISHESLEALKKAGLIKLVGKNEIIDDGDILYIRSNA